MATIKYFGIIAESVKQSEETIAVDSVNLNTLISQLNAKYSLANLDFQVAVNRKIVSDLSDYNLQESDEIALLPAFAGG